MKNILNTNICLMLAIFVRTLSFNDNQNEMVVGKMKDEYKEISINEFVGLKSKMHCTPLNNGKESNTAKGVNIAMVLKEYEGTFLNKKIIRHKMRRI